MASVMPSKQQEFRRAWPVVGAAAVGAATGVASIAFYSIGAFVEPLSHAFGWSRAEITAAPSFLTAGMMLVGAGVGALADQHGARKVALTSQALLALALAGMSLMDGHVWTLYLGYFLLAVLGGGTLPMVWSRTIVGWFNTGRGLALGVSLVGTGICGALLPSYISWLSGAVGWRGAFLGLAALPLVLGLPLAWLFFRDAPATLAAPAGAAVAKVALAEAVADDVSFTFGEALRTWRFWQMTIAFFIVTTAVGAVLVHSMPLMMDRGIPRGTAAALAGVLGIAVMTGRLVSGYCLDVYSGGRVAFAVFAMPALGCALLSVAGNNLALCGLSLFLVGIAAGAEYDIAAYFTAQFFGRRHFGAIYGLVYTLYCVGSGVGPPVVGAVVDASHSYTLALYAGVVGCLLAAVMVSTLRHPVAATAKTVTV